MARKKASSALEKFRLMEEVLDIPEPQITPTQQVLPQGQKEILDRYFHTHSLASKTLTSNEAFNERMQVLLVKYKEVIGLPDSDMLEYLKSLGYTPSAADNRLRLKFWTEFDESASVRQVMKFHRLHEGVITEYGYFAHVVYNDNKLLWILTPPTSYFTAVEEGLQYGLEEIRRILGMPISAIHGNDLTKQELSLLSLKVKCFELLDLRAQGGYVQKHKIEQKTVNINHTTKDSPESRSEVNHLTLEELNEEIRKLSKLEDPAPGLAHLDSSAPGLDDV